MQLLPQKSSDDNEHFSFLAKHISPEDVQFFLSKSLFLVEKTYQMRQTVVLALKDIIEGIGIPPKVPYGSTKG